jgi:putative spermidine/putrescine transport system ATP-binding protein
VRPEKIKIAISRPSAATVCSDANEIDGVVELISYLGPFTEYQVKVSGEQRLLVQQANRDVLEAIHPGQAVSLTIPPEWCFLFNADPGTEADLRGEP